jgi:hypothetical protein
MDDRIDTSEEIPQLPSGTVLILRTLKRGYGNAISEGLQHLKCDYFGVMNSDDLVHPKKFITQIQDLENQNAELSVGRIIKFNDSGKILSQSLGHLTKRRYNPRVLLLGAYGADATWCGRSENVKIWSISNELAADWITAIKNFPNFKIVYSPDALYFYRQHKDQITKSNDFKNSSFESIYTSWNAMNVKEINVPLTIEAAKLVAAPWLVQAKSSKRSISDAGHWLKRYDYLTNGDFQNLVNRRHAYLIFQGFRSRVFLVGNLIPALLGVVSYFFEKILNKFERKHFKEFLDFK